MLAEVNRFRREEAATPREFLERRYVASAYLVYDGKEILKDGGVVILPVTEFVRRLARGDVIAP